MNVRLRHLLTMGPRPAVASDPDQLVSFLPMDAIKDGAGGIIEHEVRPSGTLASGSYNYAEDGDILLAKVTPCFENGKKAVAVGLRNGRAYATSEVHVLRPHPGKIDRQFLFYVLTSEQFRSDGIASMTGAGGLKRVSEAAVLNHRVYVSDVELQRIIAAYLDQETGRVDALVGRLERLISLLTEKRQAVISHAVTKGLNPDAPMKDSGIDWLGEVPEHWERKRLYTVARFVQGKAHEPYFDDDGDYACATARFVSTGGQANRHSTKNLTPAKPGDILMVMSDLPNGRALARAYLVKPEDRIAINQRVCGISVTDGDPRYFAYQLDRHEELLRYNDGWNQTHLKNEYFTQLVLLVPPVNEQANIADRLDAELSEIDSLIENAASLIERAKERRSALISAAVTGQIPMAEMTPDTQPEGAA